MTDADAVALAPETVALLEPALRGALAEPPARAPSVADLTRYLSGVLATAAAEQVEVAAAADRAVRRRLLAVDGVLERLRGAAPGAPAAEGLEGEVAAAWRALLAERAGAPPEAAHRVAGGGWEALRRAVASGEAVAVAVWADLLAVAEQCALQLQLPRAAVTRGGATRPRATAGARILRAEVTGAGALEVEAETATESAEPLRLDLWFAGRSWPLAEALPAAGRAVWVITDLGALFGLPPGGIPVEWLRVSRPQEPPSTEGPAETTLLAPLLHPNGTPVHVPPAVVVFRRRPMWERRSYTLRFSVPSDLLSRYPSHRVRVEVPIAAGIRQALGAWPLAPEMEISSPWPGAPDQPVGGAPWPRLSLIGPEP